MYYSMILIMMMFCHVVEDFYLEGCLAWMNTELRALQQKDYKIVLMMQSLSWTCCIFIPIIYHIGHCGWMYEEVPFLVTFVLDWIIQAIVTSLKYHKGVISLAQKQIVNILQVVT